MLEMRGKVLTHKKPEYQSAKLAKEGLDKIFNIVSKKLNENRMPQTPEEKIALAEQMKKEERLFHEARKAEQEIINIRKARKDRAAYKKEADKAWRLYRREKIKSKIQDIIKGIKDVHE